jgi:NitT/TauT family transport system substrate-binding protein
MEEGMRKYSEFNQPEKPSCGKQDYRRHAPDHQPERRDFLASASGFALLAGLTSFTGCAPRAEPGLRIATNQWIGYELLYLSQSLGQLDHTGVRLVELLSNTDSVQALAAGTVDGAGLTLDEAITARAAGLDFKIVLVFDFSAGADALLVRPGIDQLSDLKGKRIGVEQTGVGALMLDAALKRTSLTAADVQVISLTVDQHLAAFNNHEVDALVTFEPIASQVEAAGGRRLFDSSSIPGSIVDVLVLSTKALEANPNTARRLIARYFHALTYLRHNPADAAQRMAPRLGLTPAAVSTSYQGLVLPDLAENQRLLGGMPSPLETTAAGLAALMLREKLIARPSEVKRLIVDSYLSEAHS